MDINFSFTSNNIANGLIILTILLSGYFFHLVMGENSENDTLYFLNVLSFGIAVVGTIFLLAGTTSHFFPFKGKPEEEVDCGFVSNNWYFGIFLTSAIIVSEIFLFLLKFKIIEGLSSITRFSICVILFWLILFDLSNREERSNIRCEKRKKEDKKRLEQIKKEEFYKERGRIEARKIKKISKK